MDDIFGLFMSIDDMARDRSFRNTAITDEIGEIIVDTCNTPDKGWETGIGKDNHFKIAESYSNEEEAKEGHAKWVEIVKNNFDFDNFKGLNYFDY